MEEEEKEKRKEKKRGEGSRNPGPSWFWADLVLGRVGFGPTWFGPSWFWAELTQERSVQPVYDSRAHTTNEWLHRFTQEKNVKLLRFKPPCDIHFNILMTGITYIKMKFYFKLGFLMSITINF